MVPIMLALSVEALPTHLKARIVICAETGPSMLVTVSNLNNN